MSKITLGKIYKVEEIRAFHEGKEKYLIKWKDFDESQNTWEPKENILDSSLLDAFEKRNEKQDWEWKYQNSEDNSWSDFDQKMSGHVETEYQKWLQKRITTDEIVFDLVRSTPKNPTSRWSYTLNFGTMKQTNNKLGTIRQLKRV
jgi:hypothetical protein